MREDTTLIISFGRKYGDRVLREKVRHWQEVSGAITPCAALAWGLVDLGLGPAIT